MVKDMNLHCCMKRFNNVDKPIGATELVQDCSRAVLIYRVKSLTRSTYRAWFFSQHFFWICWSAKIMSRRTMPGMEAILAFWHYLLFRLINQLIDHDSGLYLSCSVKKWDTMLIIARSVIAFPLVKGNNVGIFKFLRHSLLFPSKSS